MKVLFIFYLSIASYYLHAQVKFKSNLNKGFEQAAKENKPIFVDFTASWCGPCKKMKREVFTDSNLGQILNDHFINIKVDEKYNRGYINKYNIKAYPTLMFIDSSGMALESYRGYRTSEQLISYATLILDDYSAKAKNWDNINSATTAQEIYDELSQIIKNKNKLETNNILFNATKVSTLHEIVVLSYFGSKLNHESIELIFSNSQIENLYNDNAIMDQIALSYLLSAQNIVSPDINSLWNEMQNLGYKDRQKVMSYMSVIKVYLIDRQEESKRYVIGKNLLEYYPTCSDLELIELVLADVVKHENNASFYKLLMDNLDQSPQMDWSYILHDIYSVAALKIGEKELSATHVAKANAKYPTGHKYNPTIRTLRQYF